MGVFSANVGVIILWVEKYWEMRKIGSRITKSLSHCIEDFCHLHVGVVVAEKF